MNGCIAFYKGKRLEVLADTALAARDMAAKEFKAKKAWEVDIALAEINGNQVTHVATE